MQSETNKRAEFNKNRAYSLASVSILFLLVALLLLSVGGFVQNKNFLLGIFVTEYMIILLPVIWLAVATHLNIKTVLKIRKIPFDVIWRIVVISIVFLPVVGLANYIAIFLLSFGGNVLPNNIPIAENAPMLITHMWLIAFSAGLCEEMFFRGMVLNAFMNRMSVKSAIFWSAFLFGVFHFNMQNFFGPLVLGILFGNLILVTDSIWSVVIAHTTNNGIAVFLGYFFSKYFPVENSVEDMAYNISPVEHIPFLIFLAFFSVISLIIVRKIFRSITDIMQGEIDDDVDFDNAIADNLDMENAVSDMQIEARVSYASNMGDAVQDASVSSYAVNNKKPIVWYEILPILAVCALYLVEMISFLMGW